MPVRRFRCIEETESAVWHDRDDPALWRAIATAWALADRLARPRFPPGVYKNRSIEEANARVESWEAANRRRDVNPTCDEPDPSR